MVSGAVVLGMRVGLLEEVHLDRDPERNGMS